MGYSIILLSFVVAVGATYPPQPSNQQQQQQAQPQPPPPPVPATNTHTYPSNAQSPPPQQQQGYQPPVQVPVITVYEPPKMQARYPQPPKTATTGISSPQTGGGGKLKEILYILPIIQSIDRITDSLPSVSSGYGSQSQGSSRQVSSGQQMMTQSYGQMRPSAGSQRQQGSGYASQAIPAPNVNVQTGYRQVGQMGIRSNFLSMMASQAASSGYGAQGVQTASHIQLPSSYGSSSSQSQSSGYDLGNAGYQNTGSGYVSQQQKPTQNSNSGYGSSQGSVSGYGSNQMAVGGSQVMTSGYAMQMPPSSAIEVGVALKPVLSQQREYPTVSYSSLNNQPKGQLTEIYLASDTQVQDGYPMQSQGYEDQTYGNYDSGPNAYDLCEQGFNLDGKSAH